MTLLVAAGLRAYEVGRASLWYDEIVTVRLATTDGPSELLARLGEIDATRAPMHPLLLQPWMKAFGTSEGAGRSLSVVFGVLTVWLVYRVGRHAFGDARVGLWAAWLAALSPLLVAYSRETRMYAWLVLVTAAAWDALFAMQTSPSRAGPFVYAASLVAMAYSHPLGVVMAGTLGLAALLNRRAFGLSWGRWALLHFGPGLLALPWVPNYLNHEPEWLLGRQPLRMLVGMPIGYVGGNALTLAGFAALILYGMLRADRSGGRFKLRLDDPAAVVSLCVWLAVPPVFLYVYSLVSNPIFGPARYTLFVAPAYLVLVARGLSKLRWPVAAGAGVVLAALSLAMLRWLVYDPSLKSDWRRAAAELARLDPTGREPLVVTSVDPSNSNEVHAARYYLGAGRRIVPLPADPEAFREIVAGEPGRLWVSVAVRGGQAVGNPPKSLPADARPIEVDGLRLVPVDGGRPKN